MPRQAQQATRTGSQVSQRRYNLTIAGDRELYERVRAIAQEEDRTVSKVLLRLVNKALAMRERQPETTPAA
jgi:predicted transcriptional regulator